jgi:hypothetical protein
MAKRGTHRWEVGPGGHLQFIIELGDNLVAVGDIPDELGAAWMARPPDDEGRCPAPQDPEETHDQHHGAGG